MLPSATITSLVFIDASVQNYQSLINGVIPTAQAILLSPKQDSVEQITEALHEYRTVQAIHIISHGSPGTLYLGNTQLSLDTLDRYAQDLQSWSAPQLLLYGCNVAAGDAGAEFVEKLAELTGAAIAASTTPVGSAALGGNWHLNRQTGAIAVDLAILPSIQQTYSAVFAPVLTVAGSTATNGGAPSILDSDLTITDSVNPNTTLNGAQIAITTNLNANDRLGIQGQAGTSGTINGLSWNYNTGTGILALTGTATIATYESVLRQVTYYANGAATSAARNVQFSLGTSLANPNNGHFYEFVSSNGITWNNANTAASGRNYFGLQGYLVTVTSTSENAFTASKLQGEGWMGSSDVTSEGVWRWVTGPETGLQFSTGSSAFGGKYVNWAAGEPNDAAGGEDYGHFLTSGQWNDYAFNNSSIKGYVVEYGGMAGDPVLQLTGNTTLNVDATIPNAPLALDLTTASDSGASSTDNLTNITTPTITGTAVANSTVTIYDGATVLGTTGADASGNWSFTPASALSSGIYSITAAATSGGKTSGVSSALNITIDISIPAAPTSAPDLDAASDTGALNTDDLTNDTTPTFTGSGTNGDVVTLYSDGVAVGTATVANGTWSVTASALSSGSHSITSTFKDLAGNESAPSAGLPIVINTTAPTAPTSAPDLDATSDTGVSSTDDITKNTTPTFTGSGTNGDVVTLYSDGVAVGTATVANGTWSVTASALSSGSHSITSTFKDLAGNESAPSAGLPIVINTTAPTAPTSAPDLDATSDTGVSSTDNITNDTTPTFTGSGTNGDVVTLYSDGAAVGTATVANGLWSVTASALSSGSHMITSTVKNAAGNESPLSPGLSITLTTGTPSGSATTPDLIAASDTGASSTDNITSNTTPTFTGSGTAGSIVTLYSDGAAVGTATVAPNGSWSVTASALTSGNHSITSTFKDLAGNESSPSTGLALTVDTSVPTAPTVAPDLDAASDTGASNTDNITKNSTLTFKGAPGSGTAGTLVILYADGVAVGTGTVAADGSWSATTSPLTNGNRNITSTFRDLAGNESTQSSGLIVAIDSTAPTAPTAVNTGTGTGTSAGTGTGTSAGTGTGTGIAKIPNLTNDSTPTLTGNAETGSTIQVFAGTTALGTATVDNTGKWSFTPTTTLVDGTYPIIFKVTDAAGNVTTANQAQPLVIDTKPATVKILDFGGDIRESSVNTIQFQFTEAVSNFDSSDVILTLDGKPVALQGATLSSNDAQTWTLANIPGLTKNGGDYKIDIKPGKVKDAAGNSLATGASDTWLTGYTADAQPTLKFSKKRGTALDDSQGKDFLRGGKTQDRLRGFGGNDRLSGRGGNDRLLGGVGKDELRGGSGNDRLLGGSGNDRLIGGKSNDRLLGGKNNDRLRGDGGDDVLIGGQGKDILVGGTGKDTFVYNSLKERGDRIVSFESANDLIDLRGIFKGPQFKGENRFARYHQFVQLAQVGANTEIRIDADGSGSGTKFTTLAALQSTPLSNVRSTNFVIG